MAHQELYQNDPRWQNNTLGFGSTETIGKFGCLLTNMTMIGNYFGGNETPASFNEKMKANDGFQGPWVRAFRISAVFPNVRYQKHVECNNQPAPMAMIDAALGAGSLPLVRVDYSPAPGMQSHWVILHKKQGGDYLMWDPYHNPNDPESLTAKFGFAGEPAEIIQEIIIFGEGSLPDSVLNAGAPQEEKKSGGAAKPAPPPTKSTETETAVPTPATDDTAADDASIVVKPTVNGLTFRRSPGVTAGNIIKYLNVSDKLQVLHTARTVAARLGKRDQWIKVKDIEGRTGYVAAWYVTRTDDPGFGVQETAENEPTPTQKLVVKTTAEGVSLRTQPRVSNQTLIRYLPFGTELRVIESGDAAAKIGRSGQWLQVQTLDGKQGYVAAWYVTKKQ